MQHRLETATQGCNGGRRRDHLDDAELVARLPVRPAVEAECPGAIATDQASVSACVHHDRAAWQILRCSGPESAIRPSRNTATASKSLGVESRIDLDCADGTVAVERGGQCVAIRTVCVGPAQRAWTVSGRQRDCVV